MRVSSLSRETAFVRRRLNRLQGISVIVNVLWFISLVSLAPCGANKDWVFFFSLYNAEDESGEQAQT